MYNLGNQCSKCKHKAEEIQIQDTYSENYNRTLFNNGGIILLFSFIIFIMSIFLSISNSYNIAIVLLFIFIILFIIGNILFFCGLHNLNKANTRVDSDVRNIGFERFGKLKGSSAALSGASQGNRKYLINGLGLAVIGIIILLINLVIAIPYGLYFLYISVILIIIGVSISFFGVASPSPHMYSQPPYYQPPQQVTTYVEKTDSEEKLRKLSKMKEEGLITQKEYDEKKKEILKNL